MQGVGNWGLVRNLSCSSRLGGRLDEMGTAPWSSLEVWDYRRRPRALVHLCACFLVVGGNSRAANSSSSSTSFRNKFQWLGMALRGFVTNCRLVGGEGNQSLGSGASVSTTGTRGFPNLMHSLLLARCW